MVALESPETQVNDPFSQVHVHTIDEHELRLLIEGDTDGLLTGTIYVTSASGSTYEVELLGPTVDASFYGGIAKVRKAHYLRTKANGEQSGTIEYIGLTDDGKFRLRFFPTLVAVGSVEHSVMRIPSSDVLDPKVQLVIDWSKG